MELFFDLVVEVRRGAVKDAGGFAGPIEEEESGDGSDVTKRLSGRGIGDGPAEVWAERRDGRANLIFRRFDGESDDSEFVRVTALQFAEPL